MSNATVEKLLPYPKGSNKHRASWPDIWRCRHFLADILAITRGQLLRMKSWEDQVAKFLAQAPHRFTRDEVSLVARRPRLTPSHLWNAKRDTAPVPKRYDQLKALVSCMAVTPLSPSYVDTEADDGTISETESSSSSVVVIPPVAADLVDLTDTVDANEEQDDMDVDKFFQEFMKKPAKSEKKETALTRRLTNDAIEKLLEEGGDVQVPTPAEYRARAMAKDKGSRKRFRVSGKQGPDALQGDEHAIPYEHFLKYNDQDSKAVNRKRIHSRAYRWEEARCKRMGFDAEARKHRGQMLARKSWKFSTRGTRIDLG